MTAFIGPSGCGKSTLLRTLNRMYSLYPGQRADGRDPLRRAEHPRARTSTSTCCAPRSAWCSRSRRRSRCRSTTTSRSACASTRTCRARDDGRARRMGADQGGDVGRGEGQAEAERAWRCPAASSSACASRARWRCSPEVLLLDEPTSALDPISTAKIEELITELKQRLHDRDRHAQHAAGGARLGLHRLHVPRRADRVRRRPTSSSSSRSGRRPRTTSPAASADRAARRDDDDRAHAQAVRHRDGGDPQRRPDDGRPGREAARRARSTLLRQDEATDAHRRGRRATSSRSTRCRSSIDQQCSRSSPSASRRRSTCA